MGKQTKAKVWLELERWLVPVIESVLLGYIRSEAHLLEHSLIVASKSFLFRYLHINALIR